MRRVILAFAMAAVFTPAARAATSDWGPLGWLEGRWTGEGGGAQQGAGGFSFLPDVAGHVLVRRNVADYPPQNGRPAQHHEDLMVVFREGGKLKATYWDVEDQTIHYDVQASPDGVVFISEDTPGPRFRLTYIRSANGLEGRFEIAPPDDHAHFKSYLVWTAHRADGPPS